MARVKHHVLLLGATGTIGRATLAALQAEGHDVVCGLSARVFHDHRIDAVISCMASRTGVAEDAWAVDHDLHVEALRQAKQHGVKRFVLLSAICVQRPKLAFQFAKLAFEEKLMASGLTWSIVRPTAYFKSLSGQVARVKAGKPFLVFGNGALTSCKPISDGDLARYLVSCLDDAAKHNVILPIGGPGPAMTPMEQAQMLFRLLGREPQVRKVPVALFDVIIFVLSVLSPFSKSIRAKAELARIGRYYATESMLAWDAAAGRYDADATPEFGKETLSDYQAKLLIGEAVLDRGAQAVF
jgi:divinyl chlorophyllide a 8-vinyl-reductase